jgi:hypothetical protein
MFSTWSATDASSTAASSDSPAAKRRRISESTHGRRTSKATRACDVCKVNTFLSLSLHCGNPRVCVRNRHRSRGRWLLHLRHAVLAEDMTWRYSSISVATSTSSLRHVWMSARCDRMNSCAKAMLKPSLTFRRQRKLDALG